MLSHGADENVDIDDVGRALTSRARRWILLAVSEHRLCVCDLVAFLGYEKSSISRNIALLQACGLIENTREGNKKFLFLTDNAEVTRSGRCVRMTARATDGAETRWQFHLTDQIAHMFDDFLGPSDPAKAAAREP